MPGASIIRQLQRMAAQKPDRIAFRLLPDSLSLEKAQTLTFSQTHDRAMQVAAQLTQSGLMRGDRALLCFPQGLDFVVAFLGCLYAGVVAVPTSSPRRKERLSRWGAILEDASARAILCNAHVMDRFDFGVPCIVVGMENHTFIAEPIAAQADDIAFLQYTSGSTSTPKGVVVTHRMLSANLAQITSAFDVSASDHYLNWLPQFHDMGLFSGVLTPVMVGAQTTMISPAAFLRDPLGFLRLVGASGTTMIGGPDFGYHHMSLAAERNGVEGIDLSTLRVAFTGAEPIRANTLTQFGKLFGPCGFDQKCWVGCYGLAEATVAVTVDRPGGGASVRGLDAAAMAHQQIAIGDDTVLVGSGRPLDGMDVAIVSPDTGARVDGIGEIWINGPNVAQGYWGGQDNAPQLNLILEGRAGWHRTGDLGAVIDGSLFVTGRISETIIERGRTLYPQDIELTVAGIAIAGRAELASRRVAAFSMQDGTGLGLVCELTRQGLRRADFPALARSIRASVAETHGITPRRIAFLRPGQLPITPSGKIQRRACAHVLQDGSPAPVFDWTAPETQIVIPDDLRSKLRAMPASLRVSAMRQTLRQMLQQVLADDAIPPDDVGFFDIGLDSITGVELTRVLEQDLGVTLDQTVLYSYPTIDTLAEHLVEQMFSPPSTSRKPQQADDFTALEILLDADP